MSTTTYPTCCHCGASIYAEGDSCPDRTDVGERPMLPCESVDYDTIDANADRVAL